MFVFTTEPFDRILNDMTRLRSAESELHMNHTAHVALLIETSRAYGRGLLRGIIRYQREHGPWSIYFQPRGINDPAPGWLRNWKGDGILARVRPRRAR